MVPVEVTHSRLALRFADLILFAEAAAAFEELTLDHGVDQLKMQVPDAWPNSFRQARFLSAVDFVQADRFRRKVARKWRASSPQVDLLLVPSLRDEMLTITNFTGHPSLTLRAGFVEVSKARSDWAPDPQTRCHNFRRRGACRTASRSSGGCLTRARWAAPAWRWSALQCGRRAPAGVLNRARPRTCPSGQ